MCLPVKPCRNLVKYIPDTHMYVRTSIAAGVNADSLVLVEYRGSTRTIDYGASKLLCKCRISIKIHLSSMFNNDFHVLKNAFGIYQLNIELQCIFCLFVRTIESYGKARRKML